MVSLFVLALDGISSFSIIPLRLAALVGAIAVTRLSRVEERLLGRLPVPWGSSLFAIGSKATTRQTSWASERTPRLE